MYEVFAIQSAAHAFPSIVPGFRDSGGMTIEKTCSRPSRLRPECSGFAAAAHAVQYPPGPTGTCTDTLKVANVQNPGLACHPAIGDTCPGVGGIVTGFDKIPTGFAFYIQNNAVGANSTPWTGIDVFTGGSNLAASLGLRDRRQRRRVRQGRRLPGRN